LYTRQTPALCMWGSLRCISPLLFFLLVLSYSFENGVVLCVRSCRSHATVTQVAVEGVGGRLVVTGDHATAEAASATSDPVTMVEAGASAGEVSGEVARTRAATAGQAVSEVVAMVVGLLLVLAEVAEVSGKEENTVAEATSRGERVGLETTVDSKGLSAATASRRVVEDSAASAAATDVAAVAEEVVVAAVAVAVAEGMVGEVEARAAGAAVEVVVSRVNSMGDEPSVLLRCATLCCVSHA
jgi:hypothetical protein